MISLKIATPLLKHRCQKLRSLTTSLSERHRYFQGYKLQPVARRRQLLSSKYSSVSRPGILKLSAQTIEPVIIGGSSF